MNKKYGYTEDEIKKAKSVIITMPYFGTISMHVRKVHHGFVEGLVWSDDGSSYNMPEDYQGEYEYMNFPIGCVRSIEKE